MDYIEDLQKLLPKLLVPPDARPGIIEAATRLSEDLRQQFKSVVLVLTSSQWEKDDDEYNEWKETLQTFKEILRTVGVENLTDAPDKDKTEEYFG
jgi:hypothetical protein